MKLKKLLSSAIVLSVFSSISACSSSSNLSPLNEQTSYNSLSSGGKTTKYKLGFKLNTGKRKAVFNLKSTSRNGKVDLREFCSPIADQGQLGSCTAFAMGKGLREFLFNRDKQKYVPMSALFLYYNERKIDGDIDEDGGSTMATGMQALQQTGDASDSLWPYKTSKFKTEPPKDAYTDGLKYVLKGAKSLNGLQEIKDELDKKNPVVFGFEVYESFMNSYDPYVPVPDIQHEQLLGGHAVMAVGYDDAKQVLIMRNSWGTGWGDKGYFYMPYEYFKLGLVEDVWTGSAMVRQ